MRQRETGRQQARAQLNARVRPPSTAMLTPLT
jgi:hypothetical protein